MNTPRPTLRIPQRLNIQPEHHLRSFTTSPPSRQESTTKTTPPPLPLSGTLVISLEQAISAPLCTRHLADLGARILKIERPLTGDFNRHHDSRVKGQCSHFVWTNRSKESVCLDLKSPKDLAALKVLIGKADVFVQNLAPGATERLGLGYAVLKGLNEGLVVCDVSGYGGSGPYRDKKAYDLLIQAESGILSTTGTPSSPAKAGTPIADIAAGTTALTAILSALLLRQKTGQGSHLDISMLESMAEWMSFPLYYAYDGQDPPPRAGAEHASIYPYGPFKTGGGGTVMLGMQNEREWKVFCTEILEDEALIDDERFSDTATRSRNRVELKSIIEEKFKSFEADEMLEKLQRAGIANAKLNEMGDVWGHPQLEARGRWTEVETVKGKIPALKPAGHGVGWEVRMDPIPDIGEHTEAVFKEFGIER
ncbi:hypothetical protein PRZ48_014227 [Zasmidium cellare]|uniref:CoA-transferase family III n=1 Tax=Zasmidium cellare TaxID=395010 RepID=A0ABR0E0V1_ZASCE|nr:hypothetical protein PRZ48_014227 [Zasmidium cellare]